MVRRNLEDRVVLVGRNYHRCLGRCLHHHPILHSPVNHGTTNSINHNQIIRHLNLAISISHHKTSVRSLGVDQSVGATGSGHAQRKLPFGVGGRCAIDAGLPDGLAAVGHELFTDIVGRLGRRDQNQLL